MNELKKILESYKRGELSEEKLIKQLLYSDMDFAKVDKRRKYRTGYPEVIFGEGKTPAEAREIFSRLSETEEVVICTRASPELADEVLKGTPDAFYNNRARLIIRNLSTKRSVGLVVVATGGTGDGPVAEEASLVLESFGSRVERLYDVGVAGVHRVLSNMDILKDARCVVAVAGMEGALPSVISGLVSVPVIAVPTSIGYGANLKGITTLLSMLSSCAPGVSVVNIDNGFGAAYQADMINKIGLPVPNEDI